MTSELLSVFDYFEKEKGIDRKVMEDAVTQALLSALKKNRVGLAKDLRVDIGAGNDKIRVLCTLTAVETVTSPYEEIDMMRARKIKPDAEIGDDIDVDVTPKDIGRIAAQTAKQAMMQRIRQAEKEMIYDEYKDRAGDIVGGTVRRFEKSDVIIDLGKFEGRMPHKERVSTEDYNVGDRVRTYVVEVKNGNRGPEIILSRSHPNFVRRLFEFEVSEIADRTVEIRGIAREAGYRTKVAVHSSDDKVDPVGACVGLRGARVKNIVRELNNEKVDIIRWSEDPQEFVADALKPAQLRSVNVDEEKRRIDITVDEEELSKAIGRRGQNARLTSRLLGWDVQVDKDRSEQEAFEQRITDAAETLSDQVGISKEQGLTLVNNGMVNLEALASCEASDIADILGIEGAEAQPIYEAAQAKFASGN